MQNLKIGLLFILIFINVGCIQTEPDRGVKVASIQPLGKDIVLKSQNFGNYHALLIYVDDYTYLSKLETPRYDVKSVADILKNRYGFKEITTVANPKNSDELVDILDKLSQKMTQNDNLLIYYAGHGHYVQKGDVGFWLLKDARKNSRAGWISVKQAISFTLSQMSAKHILVVSDSCYSGAILRRDGGAKLRGNRDDIQYYNKIHQKKSRNALTSGALEPVLDSDPTNPNHSVFTNGFLYALQNNQKPIFTLEEKFPNIKRYVQLKSNIQTPLYSDISQTGHDMGGDFIFVDNSKEILSIPQQPIYQPPKRTSKKIRGLNSNAKKFLQKGDSHRKAGEIPKAMQLYQKSCDLKNGIGCAKLGMLYHKQYNDVKAIISFTKACTLGVQSACKVIEGDEGLRF